MHLSKLEILGFKSFANKTVVNFTNGITGIVGPNGCGKTNIVDAIRWCLGEQKSSTLRSDKMENVIFNGTRQKKPMGMAEVSLTIQNDRGLLPTDFSEVTITRRIFRSGESEYLLNKNICRLKDITNLFMDTGMGTNAYSVIELKMIETILSNKADERRKMFEEAAGVNKYKLRRRLSLNKLDDVKKDLTRVNDIVSEVEKTVRSLERQAKKADKYNQIQTELREKELGLAEREFAHFSNLLSNYKNNSAGLTESKENIDNEIRSYESKLINFRQEISNIESLYREKSAHISQLTENIYNLFKNISVAQEREKSLTNNIQRFRKNIEEYMEQRDDVEQSIAEYRNKLNELNNKLHEKESELNNSLEFLNQQKEELNSKREEYKNQNEEFSDKLKFLNSIENEIANNKKYKENFNNSINRLGENIQNITSTIAKSVGYLEELENELSHTKIKLNESEEKYASNLAIKENLDKEISELKVKELEERNHINNIKDKIEFFQDLVNNLEGVSKGSKFLIESEGWTKNEKLLLADVGSPKEKYRIAIEIALKSALNNLVIQSTGDLKNAINYLRKNNLGKASFILEKNNYSRGLLSKINNYSLRRKSKKIESSDGFINWAINLIETDKKWNLFFENSLRNTAVVNSLDTALVLSEKYPDFNFVTMEGDIITDKGIVEAGSSSNLEETLFGRKKLLTDLRNEYPKIEENLQKLQQLIEEKEDEFNNINLKVISEQGKILVNEMNNIEKQIAQIEYEKKKSEFDIEKIQTEIQENVTQLNFTEGELNKLNEEFEKNNHEISSKKNDLNNFENYLKELENKYSEIQNNYNNSNLEIERIKGEIHNTNNLINKSNETIDSLNSSIDKLNVEIHNSNEEINSIKSMIEETQIKHDELNAEKNVSSDELNKIEENLSERKRELSDYEEKLNNLRNERQNISDSIHEIQVKQNEVSLRFENLVNHIKDEYSIDLAYKEFNDLDIFNFDETSAEVHTLKEKIKNLGPINLLAYSEYEEENERLEFLHQQRNDLIESEKDLIKTIKEINESAEKVFSDTFEAIKVNFQKIFQSVFNPGDEADLVMEEGVDPLEAKIEIIAKPKGKRPTSIELLSGGEKTLTATALLFAIYLVKPSPFCIMDEVDAPLDDANVDRFTKLLRDFSDNTQFIIVTHNKRTMEAAENMYGVTIQDEGISKLVGVQFNEQLSVSA